MISKQFISGDYGDISSTSWLASFKREFRPLSGPSCLCFLRHVSRQRSPREQTTANFCVCCGPSDDDALCGCLWKFCWHFSSMRTRDSLRLVVNYSKPCLRNSRPCAEGTAHKFLQKVKCLYPDVMIALDEQSNETQ